MGARGNSGVILSQILRGLTGRLKTEDAVDGAVLAEALQAATAAAYEAVMRPVEGTILTVVRLAGEAALAATKDDGATLSGVVDAAAAAAREALERTPELLPVLAEAGVVDAGGAGFVLFLDALLHVIDGRPVSEPQAEPTSTVAAAAPAQPSTADDATDATDAASDDLRYEVMFFLEAPDENVAAFKHAWAAVGDSIVVVGGDGLWNCHIHTNDIGAAVEAAVEAGRPRQIRVTDLAEQVAHEQCLPEDAHGEPQEPKATTAVVAVGSGEGVGVIFRSLGVQAVVAGGQSMNPSTAELLQAVDRAAADAVVVLPNNKNVVAVAEQVVSLAAKPVKVPTTSIAEGFAALIGFDGRADAETNAKSMDEASRRVRWGEVTWAVRDATTTAGAVKEGEHLALLGHDIVAVAADMSDAACALLDRLVEAEDELVTVVEGEAATRQATERITGWLAEHRPEAAVEVHRGDQPLAAYLFSAE